ncbi:hypothetical protein J1N35_029138 [Gossypium stocksii]|uniref:Uncharacterized protein n=1 Tax=Gossypium stocksii TaxID=47602 RepID=A0A9D3UXI4_9ROSI|nr:hypothetical protein J1N35_029138 [Gossypium stocksii]
MTQGRIWSSGCGVMKFVLEFSMSKGGSSKVSVKVPTEYERVATPPKFKQHKVSTIWKAGMQKGDYIKL